MRHYEHKNNKSRQRKRLNKLNSFWDRIYFAKPEISDEKDDVVWHLNLEEMEKNLDVLFK